MATINTTIAQDNNANIAAEYKEIVLALRQQDLTNATLALEEKEDALKALQKIVNKQPTITREMLEKAFNGLSKDKKGMEAKAKARKSLNAFVAAENAVKAALQKQVAADAALKKVQATNYEDKTEAELEKLKALVSKVDEVESPTPTKMNDNRPKTQAEVRQQKEEQMKLKAKQEIGRQRAALLVVEGEKIKGLLETLEAFIQEPGHEVGEYEAYTGEIQLLTRARASARAWINQEKGTFAVDAEVEKVKHDLNRAIQIVEKFLGKTEAVEEPIAPIQPEPTPEVPPTPVVEKEIDWMGGKTIFELAHDQRVCKAHDLLEDLAENEGVTEEEALAWINSTQEEQQSDMKGGCTQEMVRRFLKAGKEDVLAFVKALRAKNTQKPALEPVIEKEEVVEKMSNKDKLVQLFEILETIMACTPEEFLAVCGKILKAKVNGLEDLKENQIKRVLAKGEEFCVSYLNNRRVRLHEEAKMKAEKETPVENETNKEPVVEPVQTEEKSVEKDKKKVAEALPEPTEKVSFEPSQEGFLKSLWTASLAFLGNSQAQGRKESKMIREALLEEFEGEISNTPEVFLLKQGRAFMALKDIVGMVLPADADEKTKAALMEAHQKDLAKVGCAIACWMMLNKKSWIGDFLKAYRATKLNNPLSLIKGETVSYEGLPFSREGQEKKLDKLLRELNWLAIKGVSVDYSIGKYLQGEDMNIHSRTINKKEGLGIVLACLRDENLKTAKKVSKAFGAKEEFFTTETASIAALMQFWIKDCTEAQADEFTLMLGIQLGLNTEENQKALDAIIEGNNSWWRNALRGCVSGMVTAKNKAVQFKNWFMGLFSSDEPKKEEVVVKKEEKTIWEKTKDLAVSIKDSVVDFFGNVAARVRGWFKSEKKDSKDELTKAVSEAKKEGEKPSVWSRIKGAVVGAYEAVTGFFKSAWETVTGWFSSDKKEAAEKTPVAGV